MNKLINKIEKLKPLFEKISRNIYLRAIRDGFIAGMPVILFSSIFILIAYAPNAFKFYWPEEVEAMLMKPYNYTMGILALLVAGTTAKSLTDSMNRSLKPENQINPISTMLASISGLLLLAADSIENGFSSVMLGTKGLLSAFIAAFIIVNIYKVFIKNNITISMPKEVPPNISQVFKDIFAFSASIIAVYALDLLSRKLGQVNFAQAVLNLFAPIFTAADGWVGITLIFGAYAFFWFVGIHGPSIVEPAIAAVMYANLETNLELFKLGQHADKLITPGTQMFIVTFGGTGATFVVPFMFMWLTKSKRNKAIGKASVVPTFFGVNEPILFGGPIVLNPTFFIPFILAPIVNVWIFKFFVDILKMNSFSLALPWTTPGPLGIVLGTNFAALSFILAAIIIVVDAIIYYPFVKIYDKQVLEQELNGDESQAAELKKKVKENFDTSKSDKIIADSVENKNKKILDKATNVLVLCAGGGTSGLLANALNDAAKEHNQPVRADAGSYGAHYDIMKNYDLIVLAPQVASNYDDIKVDAEKVGVKVVKTEGAQYIGLTRDGLGSLNFIKDQLS